MREVTQDDGGVRSAASRTSSDRGMRGAASQTTPKKSNARQKFAVAQTEPQLVPEGHGKVIPEKHVLTRDDG
jgi:hypothetical protein